MKLLFFDIDGTLATRFYVPESTRIAFDMTRKKGRRRACRARSHSRRS